MKTFKIADIYTGTTFDAELVKETKCYYVVNQIKGGKAIERRFHKATMYIDYLHLSLRITERPKLDVMGYRKAEKQRNAL